MYTQHQSQKIRNYDNHIKHKSACENYKSDKQRGKIYDNSTDYRNQNQCKKNHFTLR